MSVSDSSLSTSVIYHVRHDTIYAYQQMVRESRQLLRLSPRNLPWQRVHQHRIDLDQQAEIEPSRRLDSFGNLIHNIWLQQDHDHLRIRADSKVEVFKRVLPDPEKKFPWEEVRDVLAYQGGRCLSAEMLDASCFAFESSYVRIKRDLAHYARECFPKNKPIWAGALALMHRIFKEFKFDPNATTISTPVMEVFEKKRGVCQDFAHLMLSCLRSIGLAARYMSGYLLTHPPKGQARRIGADASHAWVAIWVPGYGWLELDPTNDLIPSLEHITIGWGRDFSDVSPLRGVLTGGGAHDLSIAVTVMPDQDWLAIPDEEKNRCPQIAKSEEVAASVETHPTEMALDDEA